MAKTFNQLKKTVGGLGNSGLKESKDEKKAFKDIKISDYDFSGVKSELEKTIRLDSLESDLSSMGKTIEGIYNGWQTQETMNNTRTSVESMQNRLSAYKEYQKLFGNKDSADISKLQSSYKAVLDGWDDIAKHYGNYKSADAYNNALKVAEKQATEYESMKSADLEATQTEITDLEGILKTAKEYEDNIRRLQVKQNTWEHRSRGLTTDRGYTSKVKEAEAEYNKYLESMGYGSAKELEKLIGEKKQYKNRAEWIQKGLELASVGDEKSENYDKDFAKKSKYVQGKKSFISFVDEADEIYDYINADEKRKQQMVANIQSNADSHLATVGYDYMTDKEVSTYNYYYNQFGKDKAKEYLNTIIEDLGNRKSLADFERYEGKLGKELLFGVQAGLDQFVTGTKNLFNTSDEYIPVNATQQLSGLVREDIQTEHGTLGQIGYDLINTTSNMLPSILTSVAVSTVNPVVGANVGAGLMGASAAGNAYQEMLNLGYDKGQARTYSTLVGISEAGLQRFMGGIGKLGGVSGKLSKVVSGIDNGLAKFAVRWGGSALAEGFEEAAQEVLTPLFTNIAAGYDTGADVDWSEVVYSGLLGALSGGVLEGGGIAVNSLRESSFNKAMGQNIKSNERVSEVFDIASNPEVASAYETYTRYANKGINADNISDAKLGNLYSMARADAVKTLNSKKSTDEQRSNAMKTLAKLSVVETENTVKKDARERFNVGEETKVTESGDTFDIKDLKIKEGKATFDTEKGEISAEDVTLTQNDAELVVLAEGIAETDGKDIANLFISQYDGKTNAEEYANDFNLATAYAKNNFTYDTILKNKGVLSTDQVKAIYSETRIKADKEAQNTINKLNEKMADTMTYKGFIDDSAITEEVWSKLDKRQQQAVTFIKGFAQATGMNLVLTHNPDSNHGGAYTIKDNTITVDVAKYKHIEKGLMETIIPTMSHETTHWMEEKSPELWRNMNALVFSTLQEADGIDEETRIKIEQVKLKNKRRKGTVEEARSEIIARACEDMLSMSEQGKKMFNSLSESEQKTLVGTIREIIQNLKNWVNELLGTYKSDSNEAKIMRQYEDKLNRLSKLWDEMLKKSVVANQSLEKSGAYVHENTVDGDVQYSIRDDYASEIEAWKKDGMPKGETFILGTTGDVLQGLGAIESDIYMLGDKIKEILKTHPEMTIEEIKKIPQILENPILILKSQNVGRNKKQNTRLVIYGNVKAQDGKPILSVLDLRPVENHLAVDDMQKVSSAYTKDANPVDFVKNSLVVYVDKKRTTKLLRTIGFYAPIELQQSGYIGSISYVGQNVNIKGEEFSKVFKEGNVLYADRDTEYLELAKNPEKNEARLREMVYEAAKEAGYTDDSSWRMGHTAPNSQDDVSLDKLKESGLVPDDFWEHPEWYTHSYEERESYRKVKEAIERQGRYDAEGKMVLGKPAEAKIWVYRAVDKTRNTKEDYFRNGDWVTPSYEYAVNEGKMNPKGYRIIKHSVSIKHLYWDGNSIAELGYDDGNKYAYADTLNNRKLLDPVTYDDYGDVIPLSKRFKRRNWDVRYSERDTEYLNAVESGDVETTSRMVEEAAEKAFSNSKVRGSDGKLRLVYHGTVNDFTVFNRQFANIEGDFGKGYYFTSNEYDVDANYATEEGPDLKNKISRLAERLEWEDEYSDLSYEEREEIARQRLVTSEPSTITAYLNMENPVYITPDENGTLLDFNESYDEEYDEYGEPEGLLIDFVEALNSIASDYAYNDVDFSFLYEYAYDNGGVYASDAVKTIKHRITDELTDENGDLAVNEVIRLAFEEIGFDGIIDTSVYYKFNNMSGMDSGTTHYIVFDSEQIKSADIATYDDNGNVIPLSQRFNKDNDDIRYSDRDYVAYDSTAILKESTIDLYLRGYASEGTPNYAQAYITYMSPRQFLQLTTKNAESQSNIEKQSKKLNLKEFEGATQFQPIQLKIDHKTGEVVGHEGRHRMVALANEDIYNVPVLLFDSSNKTSKENLNDFTLTGQFNEYRIAIVEEAIPLNYANRDLIIEKFGTQSSTQKVGERLGIRETLRYSDRDDTSVYDLMGEKERILEENEKFKAEIERLKERLKIERKVTHGNYFNENQLETVAGHLRNIAKSTYSKEKLVDSLKDVYSFIAHSPELTWEEVFEKSYHIAEEILAEAKPITMVNDYYKQILKDIRNTSISLSKSQKAEAQHIFGKNWNRNFFGKVIVTDKGLPIDSQWQEWSSMYPGFFDADVNDADMIVQLYDTLNSLKEASETVDEYAIEEQKRWLAREIYNQYWNVSPIRTTADKYDRQIRQLNFEHRRIMTEFREEYNSKLKEQRNTDKERYKKLVDKIRERKDKEIAFAKEHGREKLHTYKENAERKTRIQRITANALSLNEMLIKNSKDKHVPEIMREPVTALLQAIDFSSKRLLEKGEPTQKDISLSKALSKVKDMMVKATNAHNELVELYGHGLDEDIEKMVDSVDDIMRTVGDNEFVINRMTLTDLQTLDKVVKTITHAVNKLNKFHTVNHAKGIANLSQESVLYLDSLGKAKIYDGLRGKAKKILDWNNALSYYVFKRYGSGGMKVYEALQDGWDKFAFNTKKIIDYANESYTSKEVKEWSEEVKTFKILIPATEYDLAREDYVPQYQEVQLTVPQIMSMYCLNKREQARGHLFKGGIRVADFKTKKGNIVSQSEGIVFTEKDVRIIFDSLTERQKAVADKLQEFMNTVCADWGNDVSMARFGYKAFGEENYFPIQSDKNNLAVNDETEQPNSLFKLLNMSFTKSTIEKANNRIVISDIFDVFAQHTSDMAKYNALALPVLDSFKWYNYTEKEDIAEGTFKTRGVKQSIEKAFGKDGQNYFTTFLKDINGTQETDREQLSKSFMRNYKIASVGANLRVIALQPTSYVRASAVIDNKYLVKALGHKPKINKAETHCGIALWKSMGYFDTNIQRGVAEQIKHDETFRDKATDLSMKGAEVADKITWGYLWNACELEIRDKQKDLKVGSKEFYDAIGKRLREVIYATQVVDSTMTRSQMMRSTKMHDQIMTNFASEPTLAYNMLQDAYMEYSLDARRMGKKEAIKKNGKRIARIVYAYTMTNAVAALVESAFDAFRDDDDEEMDMATFMMLYLKNFASDMSITGKIPFIKEIHSLIKGYSVSRSELAWMESSYKAVTGIYKNLQGKGKPVTTIKNSLKTISYLSSLPFYNVYRDTMALLNKLDLFTAEDLNEMFEDFFLYGILGEEE